MSFDQQETQNLIVKAKLGNQEALNNLFARYQDRVLRIVRLRLGSQIRNKLQSMDLLQEVFLAAFQKIQQFEPTSEGAFIHWLAKIVQNKLIDHVNHFNASKRKAPYGEIPLDSSSEVNNGDGQLKIDPPANDTTPSQIVIRQDAKNVVDDLLAKLKEDEREIIIYHSLEELTFKEIGQILNKSEDAVRKKYQRAMLKLVELAEGAPINIE